jgi:hypothetical protein
MGRARRLTPRRLVRVFEARYADPSKQRARQRGGFARGRNMHTNAFSHGRTVAAAALLLAALLGASPSRADSALAVGLPADVGHDGFASGFELNATDMDTARKGAIAGCQKSVGASETARKLCKVVATFHNQCFAVAIDPDNGTPGVGWSIAENQTMADSQAIAQCRTTAGPSRQQYCVISEGQGINRGCDGTAK